MADVKQVSIVGQHSEAEWMNVIASFRAGPEVYPKNLAVSIDAPFIEPYQIVSLACLLEEYYQNGSRVVFLRNQSLANEYLNYIRFFEYWEAGYDRNAFMNSLKKTTLALWKISQTMISTYADVSTKHFADLFFQGKDLSALHIALSETFNNIFDHSQSPVAGFVLTQYYPKLNRVNLALCDFGNGIPATVATLWHAKNKRLPSENLLLLSAFKPWITTKSTQQNRGFGLPNLLGNLMIVGGEVVVYSNKAVVHFQKGRVAHWALPTSFRGTLLKLSFMPDNLPATEPEFDNEEFFF